MLPQVLAVREVGKFGSVKIHSHKVKAKAKMKAMSLSTGFSVACHAGKIKENTAFAFAFPGCERQPIVSCTTMYQ